MTPSQTRIGLEGNTISIDFLFVCLFRNPVYGSRHTAEVL